MQCIHILIALVTTANTAVHYGMLAYKNICACFGQNMFLLIGGIYVGRRRYKMSTLEGEDTKRMATLVDVFTCSLMPVPP